MTFPRVTRTAGAKKTPRKRYGVLWVVEEWRLAVGWMPMSYGAHDTQVNAREDVRMCRANAVIESIPGVRFRVVRYQGRTPL